jgi:hypothetical protein
MWLINVETFTLEEFFEGESLKLSEVPYAILSHRWNNEEVSFREMQALDDRVKSKKGFAKIRHTVEQAKRDKLKYAWVDTCCIDKTSSAELSEAINSMYRWYQDSTVCYAYLADVSHQWGSWELSDWFNRGWTLQELIAPQVVEFYDKDWVRFGEKVSYTNTNYTRNNRIWSVREVSTLSEITGIPHELLFEGRPKETYSVAQRMSWAANRVCARTEDIAYCLLGLFDINMPLLYGEGRKAFARLQEEIIKTTDDHSIFAWTLPDNFMNPRVTGILASSPSCFAQSADIIKFGQEKPTELSSITKLGLQIYLLFTDCRSLADGPFYRKHPKRVFNRVVLNCMSETEKRSVELLLIQNNEVGNPANMSWYRVDMGHHLLGSNNSVDTGSLYIIHTDKGCANHPLNSVDMSSLWLQNIPGRPGDSSLGYWKAPRNNMYDLISVHSDKPTRWIAQLDILTGFKDRAVFVLEARSPPNDVVALVCGQQGDEFGCALILNPPFVAEIWQLHEHSPLFDYKPISSTAALPDDTPWPLSVTLQRFDPDTGFTGIAVIFDMPPGSYSARPHRPGRPRGAEILERIRARQREDKP